MSIESCKTCRFFYKGTCRRYAPRQVSARAWTRTHWPPVLPMNWCGEYEPKDKGAPGEPQDIAPDVYVPGTVYRNGECMWIVDHDGGWYFDRNGKPVHAGIGNKPSLSDEVLGPPSDGNVCIGDTVVINHVTSRVGPCIIIEVAHDCVMLKLRGVNLGWRTYCQIAWPTPDECRRWAAEDDSSG